MGQIEKFVKDSGVSIPAYNVCFYDSNGTDEILDNILCGKKRANTGPVSYTHLAPAANRLHAVSCASVSLSAAATQLAATCESCPALLVGCHRKKQGQYRAV